VLTSTGTTLNIMSLMGIVMMVGVVVSNSILIVEFTHRLMADGMPLKEAVQFAARVRLRPILMTSLATVIGLIPMALALEAGSESYAHPIPPANPSPPVIDLHEEMVPEPIRAAYDFDIP